MNICSFLMSKLVDNQLVYYINLWFRRDLVTLKRFLSAWTIFILWDSFKPFLFNSIIHSFKISVKPFDGVILILYIFQRSNSNIILIFGCSFKQILSYQTCFYSILMHLFNSQMSQLKLLGWNLFVILLRWEQVFVWLPLWWSSHSSSRFQIFFIEMDCWNLCLNVSLVTKWYHTWP